MYSLLIYVKCLKYEIDDDIYHVHGKCMKYLRYMFIKTKVNCFKGIASHQSHFFVPSVTWYIGQAVKTDKWFSFESASLIDLNYIASQWTTFKNHIPYIEIAMPTLLDDIKKRGPQMSHQSHGYLKPHHVKQNQMTTNILWF